MLHLICLHSIWENQTTLLDGTDSGEVTFVFFDASEPLLGQSAAQSSMKKPPCWGWFKGHHYIQYQGQDQSAFKIVCTELIASVVFRESNVDCDTVETITNKTEK